MGSENGALIYNAQKFWEMNEKRGGRHTGDDLNGIGGMNTDLGDPVFAAGDGLVVYAGEPSEGWGNIVVLAHRDPQGKPVHTMYAHLHEIKTMLDTLVARGEVIGTVGTGNGYYPAHLHFEARASDGADIGAGYTAQPLNRLDPAAVVAALHDASEKGIFPTALQLAHQAPEAPWTSLEIKGAEKFSELDD
jgi:murein DD-endopeptidase MepM/ murein hydrolase activator NlpD